MARCVLLSLLIMALLLTLKAGTASAQYASYDDITYATVGTRPLQLALRIPSDAGPSHRVACVIWVHGGGWEAGTFLPVPDLPMRLVLERDIAVASVNYRRSGQHVEFLPESVTFPAQIQDVKGAVRWLRAHAAEYDLDPERFGAWGTSAGGHLAALLGTSGAVAELEGSVGGNGRQSSRVQVFADYSGPTDILDMALYVTDPPGSEIDHDAPDSPESHLVGWDGPDQGIGDIRAHEHSPFPPYPTLVHTTESANPITWVDPSDPPGFIAQGDQDNMVPLGMSDIFDQALTASSVPHEYHVVTGAGHGDLGVGTDNQAIKFLGDHLAGAQSAVGGMPDGLRTFRARLEVTPNPCAGYCRLTVPRGEQTDHAAAEGAMIAITDVSGRRVRTLDLAADGTAWWNGHDASGESVAPGLYLATLMSGDTRARFARIVIIR